MIVARTVADLHAALEPARQQGRSVGLVPTMGALHDGHLELARRARAETDVVVMSVFVNPTQFNDSADLAAYPRTEDQDRALAEAAGVTVFFAPTAQEVYPSGFASLVGVRGPIAEGYEGAHRGVGHFDGVCTVVDKLLMMTRPRRAFFGQKDAQQLRVVQRMVADLDIDVEIVAVPTVREPDGLAMSSRNGRLDPDERRRAVALSRTLGQVREELAHRPKEVDAVLQLARAALRAEGFVLHYLDLVDPDTFTATEDVSARDTLLVVAATLGSTRLIDNVAVQQVALE